MNLPLLCRDFARHNCYAINNTIPKLLIVISLLLILVLDWLAVSSMTQDVSFTVIGWSAIWPLILGFICLFLSLKKRLLFVGFTLIISTLVIAIDRLYFYFFQSLPSLVNAKSMSQIWDVHYSLYLLINPLTFLPILFGIFVMAYFGFIKNDYFENKDPTFAVYQQSKQSFLNRGFISIILLCVLVSFSSLMPSQVLYAKSQLEKIPDNRWAIEYLPIAYAAEHGLNSFHFKDFTQYLISFVSTPNITQLRINEIDEYLKGIEKSNKQTSDVFGLAKGRNIVFIQMESWSEFLVDLTVDGEAVTPAVNAIKEDGLYFSNIYDVTLHGRTSDAEFAVMTGLLPDTRMPAQMSHMSSYFQSLPAILKQQNYNTIAIHGHDEDFWNISNAHAKYQINKSYFDDSFENESTLGLGVNDKAVFEFAADIFSENNNENYFGLLISLTSHHPFVDVPNSYKALFPSLKNENGLGFLPYFLRSVKYSDDAISTFFMHARKKKSFNNTMYVIYGDHDPGVLNNSKTVNDIDIGSMERDKIPLVIYLPGKEQEMKKYQQTKKSVTGGLHDLMPTVLHLLGLEIPYGITGQHLFVANEQRQSLPLPSSPLHIAKNNKVYKGSILASSIDVDFRQSYQQQLNVRDILDFNLLKDKL